MGAGEVVGYYYSECSMYPVLYKQKKLEKMCGESVIALTLEKFKK